MDISPEHKDLLNELWEKTGRIIVNGLELSDGSTITNAEENECETYSGVIEEGISTTAFPLWSILLTKFFIMYLAEQIAKCEIAYIGFNPFLRTDENGQIILSKDTKYRVSCFKKELRDIQGDSCIECALKVIIKCQSMEKEQ